MDVETNKPATKSRDIRDLCHPRPLSGGKLNTLYVETDSARNPECGIRHSIKSILDSASTPVKRILVYGHQGCGKSTELALLAKELDGGWLCVNFSIQTEANIYGLRAEDVLLVIAGKVVEAAKAAKLDALETDERLKKVGDWFKQVTKTSDTGREAELEFGAGAEAAWAAGYLDWANCSPNPAVTSNSAAPARPASWKKSGSALVISLTDKPCG